MAHECFGHADLARAHVRVGDIPMARGPVTELSTEASGGLGSAERERARTVRAGRDPDLVFASVRADLGVPLLKVGAVGRADISAA